MIGESGLLEDLRITPIQKVDLADLDRALRNLSETLGDTHRADIHSLEAAAFGPNPAIRAMLARRGLDTLGAVVFSSAFSTVWGAAGLLVSDLWVSDQARGQGIGPALLAGAAHWAQDLWLAEYMKISVYDTSPKARKFYDRLGFVAQVGEKSLILNANGLSALKGCR